MKAKTKLFGIGLMVLVLIMVPILYFAIHSKESQRLPPVNLPEVPVESIEYETLIDDLDNYDGFELEE